MNVLIVHSTQQHGHDPFIRRLWAELEPLFPPPQNLFIRCEDADVPAFKLGEDLLSYDLVVCVNAVRWYSLNRLLLRGSPRFVFCCFTGDDIHRLLNSMDQINPILSLIMTNCYALQKQLTHIEVRYVAKPMGFPAAENIKVQNLLGCVVPNIKDRDFSLVRYVVNWLKAHAPHVEFPIVFPDTERMHLPGELEQWRTPVDPKEFYSSFARVRCHVAAPRLTDLKVGIVPNEFLQVLATGRRLLLPYHPLLASLGQTDGCFKSLVQLEKYLWDTINRADPISRIQFTGTVSEFASVIFDFWRTNAAPSGAEVSSRVDGAPVQRAEDSFGEQLVVEAPAGSGSVPAVGDGVQGPSGSSDAAREVPNQADLIASYITDS